MSNFDWLIYLIMVFILLFFWLKNGVRVSLKFKLLMLIVEVIVDFNLVRILCWCEGLWWNWLMFWFFKLLVEKLGSIVWSFFLFFLSSDFIDWLV